eukprot:TRINITY_DN301_c0_g3_i2.p1 TRINITY_DN301_c0_g3~~TRINITY_DN301_c0_g3_i2.p1  ORF type:complete len:390 (-),score=70.75 TRINITY_DN301_c0_g3_i2:1229-2398(-)
MAAAAAQTVAVQWEGLKVSGLQAKSFQARTMVTPIALRSSPRAMSIRAEAGLQAGQEASPATPPSSESGTPVPVMVGAGLLLGAAAYAGFSKVFAGAPSPAAAVAAAAPAAPKVPFVKKAAAPALATISHYFPNAMQDESFVRATAQELFNLGFSRDNCIALVNTCRDEVCRPLSTFIDEQFGLSFNIAGLGGLINCGKTGLKAAMSHSPEFPCDVDGKPRERYVFFAFPHVSIGETGEVGSLLRRGRGKPSSACGALIAIKNGAKAGPIADDPEDAEFVTLKRKVLSQPICTEAGPAGPTLIDVTKACLQVLTEDLENLISKTVDPETSDYAVITGVQIHSGNQIPGQPFQIERTVDYVAPGVMYAVIRGERRLLTVNSGALAALSAA